MVILLVLAAIVVVLVLYVIYIYNSLVTLKSRIDNAWSQIDVQLKKRFDLVPNLVETVKGYAKHEKETFEMVTKARTQMMSAGNIHDKAEANNMLTGALKTLFAVAEAYPELKANQNFLMLQEELSGIENKIAYARQFYNDSVMEFNIKIQAFPSNILAGIFGFRLKDYFQIEEAAREPVKVKF